MAHELIYMDNSATSPVDEEVLKEMLDIYPKFTNVHSESLYK